MRWIKTLGKWAVLWPVWERMPWPQGVKTGAAVVTGSFVCVMLIAIAAAAAGGGTSTQEKQTTGPSATAADTPVPVTLATPATSPALMPGATATATLPSSPAAVSTPATAVAAPRPADCIPPRPPQEATLVRVVDGDTIEVSIRGQTARVRYIGVDTPERDQPYYTEATRANERLLAGGRLYLYRDVSETDQFGRLLRYVVAGDRFVNLELVRQGYAQVATYPPDVACERAFVAAQREAREAQVGLWAPAPSAPPQPSAPPVSPPQPSPTTSQPPAPARHVTLTVESPVRVGSRATATAQAWPGASCSIEYITPAGRRSTAQGLEPKVAGPDGTVTWTWNIGPGTTPGTGSVTVTCDGVTTRASIVVQ